jgi:uncharacterized protein (TIGR02186 family)
MIKHAALATTVFVALFALALTANAQRLVADLSDHHISLSSSFTGTEIIVFGTIEDVPEDSEGAFDIAVVVQGPPEEVTVRRKERVAGIWMNTQSVTVNDLPSFYYVASSSPFYELMSASRRSSYEIGTDVLGLPDRPFDPAESQRFEQFRMAMVNLLSERGLVVEEQHGVRFRGERLFRARIPIPATVREGNYNVTVFLFENENVIGAQNALLTIDKVGLEGRLNTLAHTHPFIYGLMALFMALIVGLGANFILRSN